MVEELKDDIKYIKNSLDKMQKSLCELAYMIGYMTCRRNDQTFEEMIEKWLEEKNKEHDK